MLEKLKQWRERYAQVAQRLAPKYETRDVHTLLSEIDEIIAGFVEQAERFVPAGTGDTDAEASA